MSTKRKKKRVETYLAILVCLLLIQSGTQSEVRAAFIAGWGSNNFGQATPPAGNDFIAIAAGTVHSLALKKDGSIVGWGRNHYGQTATPSGNDFVAIAAGNYHGLALKKDGSVVGWGANDYGQATPPAGNDFVSIAAGDVHSLALKKDGSVVGWGWNQWEQTTSPAGNDFVAIAAGKYYSLALKKDGSIAPWGADYGNCPTDNNFVALAVGVIHSLALYERNPAVELLYNLVYDVMALNLPRSFVRKLNDAIKMLTDANPNNDSAASNKLYNFIDQVSKITDENLDAEWDPDALIKAVEKIIAMLEAG